MHNKETELMGKSKHQKKRANGEGTLRKTDNGNYQAIITLPNGKMHYHTFKEKNYEKALDLLDEYIKPFQVDSQIALEENLLAQIRTGKRKRELIEERNTTVAVDDIWTRFLEVDKKVKAAKPQTQKGYRQHIRKLVNWLREQGITDIKKVTEEHALKFKELLFKEMCDDSVKQRMNTYRWVWRSLSKVAYLKTNPWEGEDGDIYKVKVRESGHRRLLEDSEVEKIVGVLETDEERLLFGFALYLGQRISDCACFKKSYINFQSNEVHFKPIKTKDCKDPEVYAFACRPLRALIDKVVVKGGDDDYLTPKFASMWKSGHLSEHVHKIFDKAGIKISGKVEGKRQIETGFHALRIWWATKARDMGMPESVIQKIMCHKTEKMTEHYFRQNCTTIKNGLDKFDDYFGNTTGTPTDNGGADSSLPQGVSADEVKTLVELLNAQKRDGEGAVDCLKRLVAGQKEEPQKVEEVTAVDVPTEETVPLLLEYKKAS